MLALVFHLPESINANQTENTLMAKTITLTCLVKDVQMTKCPHCENDFPMISLGIGKASKYCETDIFSGKFRNEEKKVSKLREDARKNAANDLISQKNLRHRCLVCGKFEDIYLGDLSSNYSHYRAQWWKSRFFDCCLVPIAMIALFLLGCFTVSVIEGLVLGIRAFFVPGDIRYMEWIDRCKWASIPPGIMLLWIIYLLSTQVERRRPLTDHERNEFIGRLNCNENMEKWLEHMDKHNDLVDRVVLELPNEKPRFLDIWDDSDETRWIRLRAALQYEPTRAIAGSD
jgi:hypothetical protein